MKKIALLLAACSFGLAAQAQISITTSSLSYDQTFDGLDTTAYVGSGFHGSTNLPAGWQIFEHGSSTTRNGNDYVGDYGYSNSGDTYSYGSQGSNERALGSISSGSVSTNYGVVFVNNTGSTITSFIVRYRGEQWRMGRTGRTNLDSLLFYYSDSATSVADTIPSKWTLDTALSLFTPNMGATGGPLNGNASGNNVIRTDTINLNLANGDTLVLGWHDVNILDADDGMGVDSFSVIFSIASSPRPVLLSHTPASNATGVSPGTTLTMTFDKAVSAGAGNIYLSNENTGNTTTIPANSAAVAISGATVTVTPPAALSNGDVYHVVFDSTAFDTAGYNCYGIYDTTAWAFTVFRGAVGSTHANNFALQALNPGINGVFTLNCSLAQATSLQVRVIDLNGRIVATRSFRAQKGENRLRIRTGLPAGTYLIRVDDGHDWSSVKAILQ